MISTLQIALWADKLCDVSAKGLRFADSPYDKEHYQDVQNIAIAMMAAAGNESIAQLEPLRATLFSRPTPITVGDAAVIDDDGRILLIRRKDNQKWAMPGGALDVGETPAEGVVREALEETGVHSEPIALVGVFDSRFTGGVSRHHLYQFVFLCRPLDNQEMDAPSHAHEVLDAQWFSENALPEDLDPGHVTRIPEAFRIWHGEMSAFFDR